MKIAFLFLTLGDLNHEYLWREYFKGNDGKFYVSVAKGGTYRWMPFAKKTKSKR